MAFACGREQGFAKCVDMSHYFTMEPASTPAYYSVDLSEAVVLAGFLDFWHRWLLIVMAYCALLYATTRSASALEIFAAAVVSYLGVRYPIRAWLLLWTLLLTGAAIAAAIYFAIKFFNDAFGPGSSLGFIVPCAVVASFFGVAQRVRYREESMIDTDRGLPQSAAPSILVPLESSDGWRDRVNEVLSGGWVTVLILGSIFAFWIPLWGFFTGEDLEPFAVCKWLFLALAFGAAVPWFYIPAIFAILEKSSLSLVRSTRFNPRKSRHLPYGLFLLRQSLSRPRAFLWFLAAAACLAAIVADLFLKVWPLGLLQDPMGASIPGWPATALFATSLYCYRRGSPLALRQDESWRPPAGERFTLYLRSFADDYTDVLRDGLVYRVWVSMDILRFVRFEEIVASTAWPYGRVVALSRPAAAEATQTLGFETGRSLVGGAERITAGEQWQSEVRELEHRAGSILMTVGFTSGVKWELEQFAGSDNIRKLMLLMPPGDEGSLLRTWHEFTANFPDLQQCPDSVVGRTVAIKFGAPSDPPLMLLADRRSVAACKLAISACWLPDEFLNRLLPE